MEIRDLRYFIQVVDTGSFAKAAARTNVTQPAISLAVRRLEIELGTVLLDRLSSGVSPTLFGRSLYSHASRLVNDLARMREALEAMRDPNHGRLSVCIGPTVAPDLLLGIVLGILQDYPAFQFRLSEGSLYRNRAALLDGSLDVVVSSIPTAERNALIRFENLYEDRYLVVVRSQHPLARKLNAKPAELTKYPWLLDSRLDLIMPSWRTQFHRTGIEPPIAAIDMSHPSFAREILLAADYICVLPRGFIAQELRSGQVIAVLANELSWPQTIGACYRGEVSLTPAMELFLQRMRSASGKSVL